MFIHSLHICVHYFCGKRRGFFYSKAVFFPKSGYGNQDLYVSKTCQCSGLTGWLIIKTCPAPCPVLNSCDNLPLKKKKKREREKKISMRWLLEKVFLSFSCIDSIHVKCCFAMSDLVKIPMTEVEVPHSQTFKR